MPNCFTLTQKGQEHPDKLQDIDEAICRHLGIPIHDKYWAVGWYNYVGLMLACGRSFDGIREAAIKDGNNDMVKVVDFLSANYTPNAWYEGK